MYRLNDIQEALASLVGWEQDGSTSAQLVEELTTSETGIYYQDAHPLLTLANAEAIMPEDKYLIGVEGAQPRYRKWQSGYLYFKGDKVSHDGKYYIALDNVPFQISINNTDYWSVYDIINDFLPTLTRKGITQLMQAFTNNKKISRETKDLLERKPFFDGAGKIRATIQNQGKIVGFAITPVRGMGVTTRIERVGLQSIGATGEVTMYLFHSSQAEPMATFQLPISHTNGGFDWVDTRELFMPYISDSHNAGGTWFLCYCQDDLPFGAEAINMSKDWSKEPCGTCGVTDLRAWRELTKYLQINPFSIKASEGWSDNPQLWDIEDTVYTLTQNFGLNCVVSVGCDITDFIISQREIFATALQKQVAYNALRTLAMNPSVRVNRNQSNASRMDILYELDGNTQGRKGGLGYEIEKAYAALDIDTKGIDRICLSCNNYGVKYTTA